METLTLPDYNKYLRYRAYEQLKFEIIKHCTIDGRRRYASVVIKSVTLNCADVIIRRCPSVDTNVDDNLTTLINKQIKRQAFEKFKSYVVEASSSYIKAFSEIEGPTISDLDSATGKVIEEVVSDLIST